MCLALRVHEVLLLRQASADLLASKACPSSLVETTVECCKWAVGSGLASPALDGSTETRNVEWQ